MIKTRTDMLRRLKGPKPKRGIPPFVREALRYAFLQIKKKPLLWLPLTVLIVLVAGGEAFALQHLPRLVRPALSLVTGPLNGFLLVGITKMVLATIDRRKTGLNDLLKWHPAAIKLMIFFTVVQLAMTLCSVLGFASVGVGLMFNPIVGIMLVVLFFGLRIMARQMLRATTILVPVLVDKDLGLRDAYAMSKEIMAERKEPMVFLGYMAMFLFIVSLLTHFQSMALIAVAGVLAVLTVPFAILGFLFLYRDVSPAPERIGTRPLTPRKAPTRPLTP